MDQNNKLRKFQTAVFAEVEMKASKIIEEAEIYKATEIEKNNNFQFQKASEEINKSTQDIKKKLKSDVAKFSLESKRNILKKRNEITANVFDTVTKKIIDFISSDKYQDYLLNKINRFSKENNIDDVQIFVSEKDFELAQKIKESYKLSCEVIKDNTIKLGGFIIKNPKNQTYYDETLSQKLSEQKSYFMENSELYI